MKRLVELTEKGKTSIHEYLCMDPVAEDIAILVDSKSRKLKWVKPVDLTFPEEEDPDVRFVTLIILGVALGALLAKLILWIASILFA